MHKLLIPFAIATLTVAAPAASAKAFKDNVTLPAAQPVKVTVMVSEDLAYRANNLPKKLSDRGHARSRNDGWSGNGHYGEKGIEHLKARAMKRLSYSLNKAGVEQSDAAGYELRVTVVDAKPSRPTFAQLGKQPSLSFKSYGLGGAELVAELFDASGQSLGTMSYHWYESDIRDAFYANTWSDADRAISRFSSKAAKALLN